MGEFIHIGYEIRERYANSPDNPHPGIPMPPGSATMASDFCRPCAASSRILADAYCVFEADGMPVFPYRLDNHPAFYLYDSYASCLDAFRQIGDWRAEYGGQELARDDYAIFAYHVESFYVGLLAEVEAGLFDGKSNYFNRSSIVGEHQPEAFDLLGYDVVMTFDDIFCEWRTFMTTDSAAFLTREQLLNTHGLCPELCTAERLKTLLTRDNLPRFSMSTIAKVFRSHGDAQARRDSQY